MLGGMTDSNTDTARNVARFNYAEPPPGYTARSAHEDGDPCEWVYWRAPDSDAEYYAHEDEWIAAAWAHYKARHDPPGMQVFEDPSGPWCFEVICVGAGDDSTTKDAARAAAWKWYDDRLEFEPEEGCLLEDHDGAPVPAAPVWPRCLAWPDRTVVEVKAWTADPTAPLPEVLRWRELTDGTAERWEPIDVD